MQTTPPHYHCPKGCEHPQPWLGKDGKRYCGKCAFLYDEAVECELCTPETCDD